MRIENGTRQNETLSIIPVRRRWGTGTERSQFGNRGRWNRGRRDGLIGQRSGRRQFRFGLGASAEALQLGEGAIVRALGGIDAALQAREAFVVAAVGVADGGLLIQFVESGFAGVLHVMRPEF